MTTKVETVQELAAIAADWFELATRSGDDSEYVRTRPGVPGWITDLVHDAHGDFLPDDSAAVEFIRDNDDEDAGEFADQQVDVYTGARFAWLSSNLQRQHYCDEAAAEFGANPEGSIADQVGLGQYMEASEVFGLVLQGLEDRLAEIRGD